jgi:hypothetical protein
MRSVVRKEGELLCGMKMSIKRFTGVVCTAALQLPAHHQPTEYLLRIGIEVGTQKCLCLELSFRVADQRPAHGHGEQAGRVPHGRRRSDLDRALPAPIPVSDLGWLPNGGRVFGYLRKVGQALALETWSSSLSRTSWRSRLVEGGIQTQASDEGDRVGELAAVLQQFERCLSAISDGYYLSVWIPAP